ncbi:hypothetical protein Y032_0410g950 [Ancylostoma ceylanicum]|uniref:Uncharacterized protein n=1 Tax=Ancylostoma ceylanicum TaxID=53326 RepID=A0A016X4B3_9BILA|nr:hypothetical protein Y032_0410g950 [Ancylostoma ceylanicum]
MLEASHTITSPDKQQFFRRDIPDLCSQKLSLFSRFYENCAFFHNFAISIIFRSDDSSDDREGHSLDADALFDRILGRLKVVTPTCSHYPESGAKTL